MNLTREEILSRSDLGEYLKSRGVEFVGKSGSGSKFCLTAKCPFHDDQSPSFTYWPEIQTWKCQAGCGSGTIVDAIVKFDGGDESEVFKKLAREAEGREASTARRNGGATKSSKEPRGEIVATYSYRNALGDEVYQAVRMNPKSFRQRHMVNGSWSWSMEGVERVLYRLPETQSEQTVWIVEGEKDADNLSALGFQATCNVGGAGKWLDGYTESLIGKDVVICGDNDEPGQKHVALVFDSIAGKVNSTRIVKVPGPPKSDISDFIGTFGLKENEAETAIRKLFNSAQVFTKGINLPLYSLAEMQPRYIEYTKRLSDNTLNLGNWLPTLGRYVRGLVPGELITLLGDTGTGKTALLQNIAFRARPLKTILFELELPETLMFERFIGIKSNIPCAIVEQNFVAGDSLAPEAFDDINHVLTCTESRMDMIRLESLINRAELKFGERPRVALLDYIGLATGTGKGSRYERMSNIAEELKVIAKATNVIMIIASQIHRKEGEDPEIFLHDAKDSGSIENSSGLVLGAWRDPENAKTLNIKILKNSKGGSSGVIIPCNFDGETMRITERARFNDVPMPPQRDLVPTEITEPPNDQ